MNTTKLQQAYPADHVGPVRSIDGKLMSVARQWGDIPTDPPSEGKQVNVWDPHHDDLQYWR